MPGCSWLLYLQQHHLPHLLQLPPERSNPYSQQAPLCQGSGQVATMVPTPGMTHQTGSGELGTHPDSGS